MLKKENSGGFDGSSNNWARVCDSCRSVACTVYCWADSAYLCQGCDARIHAASLVASRHKRAPAAFLCKADAASFCVSCDADIHSANPLAHRHHRVPIIPIPGTLYGPPSVDTVGGESMMIRGSTGEGTEDDRFLSLTQDADDTTIDEEDEDEDEAVSWLLLNSPVKNNNKNKVSNNNNNNNQNNNYEMWFGGEVVDDYLDLAEYAGNGQFNDQYNVNQQQQHYSAPQKSYGGDSVVPVQDGQGKSLIFYHQQQQQQQSHHLNFQLGMEYDNSSTRFSYPGSMSHSVSISSMDVSVVPESVLSETTNSHPRPQKGTIDLFSGPPYQIPPQLTPMDRGARVLRYREKKKNRKFEKTIRYASRKANAETRPRIKGRFAKRTDVEAEWMRNLHPKTFWFEMLPP